MKITVRTLSLALALWFCATYGVADGVDSLDNGVAPPGVGGVPVTHFEHGHYPVITDNDGEEAPHSPGKAFIEKYS